MSDVLIINESALVKSLAEELSIAERNGKELEARIIWLQINRESLEHKLRKAFWFLGSAIALLSAVLCWCLV